MPKPLNQSLIVTCCINSWFTRSCWCVISTADSRCSDTSVAVRFKCEIVVSSCCSRRSSPRISTEIPLFLFRRSCVFGVCNGLARPLIHTSQARKRNMRSKNLHSINSQKTNFLPIGIKVVVVVVHFRLGNSRQRHLFGFKLFVYGRQSLHPRRTRQFQCLYRCGRCLHTIFRCTKYAFTTSTTKFSTSLRAEETGRN